ncbi:hypothetical protein [Candidatus Enterovibrio escicola]|nr:hypothetical protein [Candidatus Enterovibrio escacola]
MHPNKISVVGNMRSILLHNTDLSSILFSGKPDLPFIKRNKQLGTIFPVGIGLYDLNFLMVKALCCIKTNDVII